MVSLVENSSFFLPESKSKSKKLGLIWEKKTEQVIEER